MADSGADQKLEQKTSPVDKKGGISRRKFLKRLGILAVGAKLGFDLTSNVGLDTALLASEGEIKSQIPVEFNEIEIPTANEYFRLPESVLQEGFNIYNRWKDNDSNLPPITFRKRPNYIDASLVVAGIPALLGKKGTPGESFFSKLSETFLPQTEEEIIDFRASGKTIEQVVSFSSM